MHLKFGHNELANGWSVNKEGNYGTAILRQKGKYYLAITNSLNKKMSIPLIKKVQEIIMKRWY